MVFADHGNIGNTSTDRVHERDEGIGHMKSDHGYFTTMALIILGVAVTSYGVSVAQDSGNGRNEIAHDPSDAVTELPMRMRMMFTQEMFRIEGSMQRLLSNIARGRWDSTALAARQLQDDILSNKNLSDEQRELLRTTMPAHFFELDNAFRDHAKQLAEAADASDANTANRHFTKMMASCVECHDLYARAKFPGFQPSEYEESGP